MCPGWPLRWRGAAGFRVQVVPSQACLTHYVESAAPARLVKKVQDHVADEADSVSGALLVDLVAGGDEGPVDEERSADDVFAGDETPVAAVEADGAVVAHGKVLAGGDDEVFTLDVLG